MIIGKTIDNRYKVISKIAEGGMANIFLAHDNILDQEIVLKILKKEYSEKKYIEQFKHEVDSLAELNHPNIIKVFDYREEDDMCYIVMEYLNGITLKDLIVKQKVISPEMTLDIVSKVAKALKHAHSFNLIHRDIKPQNIMILKDASIKLMDFGISQHISDIKSFEEDDSSVMGSVHYISPEQVKGEKIDLRSDIYALGIVMYEMLTGNVPYQGTNAVDIAIMHIKQHIGNISDINPMVPQSLSNVVIRATSPDINLRHQDIQSFEYDLSTCLMPSRLNEPILSFINKTKEDSLSKTQKIDLSNKKLQEEIKSSKTKDNNSKNKNILNEQYWKKVAIYGGIIAFLPILLLFIFWSPNKKVMPDLRNMTFEQAKRVVNDKLDFKLDKDNIKYENTSTVPKNIIWKQNYYPNDKLNSNSLSSDIVLTINGSEIKNRIMRDYKGLSIDFAKRELDEIKPKIKITKKIDYKFKDPNHIISQSLKPNSKIKTNETIKFVVSKKLPLVTLSDPSEFTYNDFKKNMKKNHIDYKVKWKNWDKKKSKLSHCNKISYIDYKANDKFDLSEELEVKIDCKQKSKDEIKKEAITNLWKNKDLNFFQKVKYDLELNLSNSKSSIEKIYKQIKSGS